MIEAHPSKLYPGVAELHAEFCPEKIKALHPDPAIAYGLALTCMEGAYIELRGMLGDVLDLALVSERGMQLKQSVREVLERTHPTGLLQL